MAVEEDELATHAQQILLTTANNRIPKRKAKRQPWISNTTLELIEERRNLKAGGITQDKILYKEKSREIKYSLKKDKKQYIEDQFKEMQEMHAQHKDHKLFKHGRLMTTVLKPSPKAIKDKTGKVLTENIEILSRWREYCREMYKAEQTPDTTITDIETEPEPLIDEVRWALKQISNGKSPGNDEVPIELIKEGGEESIQLYHRLILKIWKTRSWPKAWKQSIYITLPKKEDLKLCSNYRTIALINLASKILLKIIQKRLEHKIESEVNIVQAGFRRNPGTRDHIFNLRNIFEKCREYNQDLFACFIDYSKALTV